MNSKRILLLTPLLFLSIGFGEKPGVSIVSGTVVDATSFTPLAGVEVSWRSQKSVSDSAGRYELRVPPGIREIFFSARERPRTGKTVIVREQGSRLRQDVLLPKVAEPARNILALDRGSLVARRGVELESDIAAASSISVADEYGNHDQFLSLGKARVHSPVWLGAGRIAFAKAGVLHDRAKERALGVFEFQIGTAQTRQVASGIAAQFLSRSPRKDSLVVATQKELYVVDSLSSPASPRRIFGLPANQGFLLSATWGLDDRIYFTIEDSVPVDNRRSLSRSRIASIRPDGSDLNTDWASDAQYSYRYPMNGDAEELIIGRFALDGTRQALWTRNTRTGATKMLAEPALRAVYLDARAGRLYYIHQQDLHLRDLKSGTDWVIVNSVKEADYLRN